MEENGGTVYSGTVQKQECRITVTAEKAINLRWGDKTYGPYTVTEDPSAAPLSKNFSTRGIEIRLGSEILFRGGLFESGTQQLLFCENGDLYHKATITAGDGTVTDRDGNVIDPMEPSLHTVLALADGPKLESKGQWHFWLLGIFLSAVTAVSIFFADELFRFRFSFRVADPDMLEPSDYELLSRYAAWTFTTVAALVLYILGLQ